MEATEFGNTDNLVMSQVEVFWVVLLGSVAVGYNCFRGLCCLHLQGWSSFRNMLVNLLIALYERGQVKSVL